ncbi:MAG: hypothetical protein HOG73_09085 [Candidatus Marinimicrobia bacterium]|mgnify:CR=1 FL=1|jgi:hypothetical protein|nr:hypothetical protein [Candidatus Woesearchaeota archaeon]MBT5995862.1 hypothetical protein [Candidatus Neomarinimicrobiota bacterium]
MIKFEEYLQLNADDSIEQVMNGEWIQKSRSSWKIVDEKDNKLEIHNDGHDPELNGESWSVHSNTFAPKAFAFFCKQFIKETKPSEVIHARTRIYPPSPNRNSNFKNQG